MQNKIKLRDRIIGVASDLFHRQGYNQTGVNQIIAEADIAYASLYNNFSSKNDLLIAYLEKQSVDFFDRFDSFSKGISKPKEKLFKLIDYRVELQKPDFLGCPFTKIIAEIGTADSKVHRIVEQHKDKQRKHLYELLMQIECTDLLDKRVLSDSLFLMIEGATVNSTVSRNFAPIENVRNFLMKIII
ncbi:transcriptional regulator, TetR family [Mucilaginibacter mallensis]|uniref:Transcriptional regulator, TetR family n=1 Tax=Mucilaginibacter mallensis TaxID=652787 RepID=A0A1H2BGB6_MUCMA|nr:TetR/AcrR family transcriptional regulator [Mucilaginibacter mallensis]SDT57238.1 transcriptional regulator, TetR family [Mucilaginibacter mallensis]